MTYQKLSLTFAAIAAALLLVAGAHPGLAQGISGAFAFNGSGSCITVVPPASFDSSFRPTAGPVYFSSYNSLGYRIFNLDGTGTAVTLLGVNTYVPVPPDSATAATSSGSSWEVTSDFTYTVNQGTKIITISLKPNSYVQTFLSGPRAGQTATQDVLSSYGYLMGNGNTLLLVSKGTEVETKTYSNSDVRKDVCNRSSTGYRLP
jgi:hypothetical protein